MLDRKNTTSDITERLLSKSNNKSLPLDIQRLIVSYVNDEETKETNIPLASFFGSHAVEFGMKPADNCTNCCVNSSGMMLSGICTFIGCIVDILCIYPVKSVMNYRVASQAKKDTEFFLDSQVLEKQKPPRQRM